MYTIEDMKRDSRRLRKERQQKKAAHRFFNSFGYRFNLLLIAVITFPIVELFKNKKGLVSVIALVGLTGLTVTYC